MAKVKKISHVGVAVENVDRAISLLRDCFGAKLAFKKTIPTQRQISAMVSLGEATFELMEPTEPDSVVAKFIKSRGEGLHHVSIEVEDINELVESLEAKGIKVVGKLLEGPGPKFAFVHPKGMLGILIELVEG